MARFQMGDGTVVDTKNAATKWDEATRWNGNNHISVNTGSQWIHETLYKSRKGRYYIVRESQWQGSSPSAEWVSEQEATRWLVLNEKDIPDDLEAFVEQVTE
jgi:hypothetical protein